MAVNLQAPEKLLHVDGVRLSACCAGMYPRQRLDLVLIEFEPGTLCAGVFTQNSFSAAPVKIAKRHQQGNSPRYFVINAGNANAGTGARGLADAEEVCKAVAAIGACKTENVLPFSTGVIGAILPVEKIIRHIPILHRNLDKEGWMDAAEAIMTTDTVLKGVSKTLEISGNQVTITGIAKGSGMIKPDMATMLAFVATDIKTDQKTLATLLENAVNVSFNRISVDGDTSTNDACMLSATGTSGVRINPGNDDYNTFEEALIEVFTTLAKSVIRDGEGATKFITIIVQGGASQQECLQAAYSIANSPLVKTAFFASDPNWGRILAAVGRAGITGLDIQSVEILLDNLCLIRRGELSPDYSEEAGKAIMLQEEISIIVRLGRGPAAATVWTCDLSHEYVQINADYRT